jgi:hypothetical protein
MSQAVDLRLLFGMLSVTASPLKTITAPKPMSLSRFTDSFTAQANDGNCETANLPTKADRRFSVAARYVLPPRLRS